MVEKFQQALGPLDKIVENQEIIIGQNKELQETLNKIYIRSLNKTNAEECLTRPDNLSEIDMEEELSDEI